MRTRAAVVTVLVAVAAGLAGLVAPAGAREVARAAPVVSRLTAVRAAGHAGYDRLVFEFAGPVPANHTVTWVPRVVQDPSGRPLVLRGRAFLRVVLRPAAAHTATGAPTYRGALTRRFDLPMLASLARAGDFEGVLSFGVGLWRRSPVHVFTLTGPSRVVVDVTVPAAAPPRLTALDNGRLVFLRAGQRTTVALRTCVACGDAWRVVRAPQAGVVRIAASSVVPLPHAPGVVGFPYESRWSLQATGAGFTRLELVERGPQRGAPPLRTFALRVRVTR